MHSVDPTIQTRSPAEHGRGSRFCACSSVSVMRSAPDCSCWFGVDRGTTSAGARVDPAAGRRIQDGGQTQWHPRQAAAG
jgi:hypothetical protein